MLRHSYALRWYSILSAVWDHRLDGFTETEKVAFREQFGDVWFQLATLLGHRSPETTKDWYLEPFVGLEIDYIFALLDDDDRAAVDSLLRKTSADSDLVLSPVRLEGAADNGRRAQGGAR
ncbi:hypothetical protein KGA66_25250 [Actinocrinis puniceicyclus]|uniref:Uncharacterized protein n=1 Tax=Actinocrinis puniceicyclus TaxID=977794 RepID=A0A8J7WV41_9ACTN|nr:hypothetical protein [Actinocrinis puniceicyclus]MBS2966375.1 hypothetical protein [Actinocrinis puniceicyclus]